MSSLSQTIAMPIWAVFVAIAAMILLAALIRGLEIKRQFAVVGGIAALLAAMSSAITPSQQRNTASYSSASQSPRAPGFAHVDQSAERRSLEARRADLAARAATPGSPLACLDALTGVSVESGCEQAIFASPTSAAVAVSYATARLQLLAEGAAFARRADPSYERNLADLRLAAQNDAYGIYAHVLATRDGCTAEQCPAFALLDDPSTLKVHLRQRVYEGYLAQYRDRWALASMKALPAPTASSAASMALAASGLALAPAASPVPLPKSRPAQAEVSGPDALAAAPAEPAPAVAERRTASIAASPGRPRDPVPPAASVVPNLSYPSASSIPPINIMAPEPKLPASAEAPKPPSTPPTARQPPSRSR